MTQPISSENLAHEEYVDGLRQANAAMLKALRMAESTLASFYRIQYAQGISKMADGADNWVLNIVRDAIAGAHGSALGSSAPQIITVRVEGGLVQDVTGIPAGYALHVEDYDGEDTSHPAWNAEKECFVTIYDGGA